MSDLNPIVESPERIPEHLLQIPQYVKDARKEEEKELTIQTRIKSIIQTGKQIKKKKVQAKPIYITPKQFNSFIDRNYGKQDCCQNRAIRWRNWHNVLAVAEGSTRELREMLKSATKEEQIVLNELMELKLQELDIIFNHIKRR